MQNQLINLPNAEVRVCDSCGKNGVRMSFESQSFSYGTEDAVALTARVPVWTCQACGEQYTDHVAEEIRHAAICKHLGRLTPKEIIDLRSRWSMTQSEWSEFTGLGIASIKRWEAGNLIQGAAFDKYMRLLGERENIERLSAQSSHAPGAESRKAKFRTELSLDAKLHAASFRLRSAGL